MKKTITAGLAALALTLTACGEDDTQTPDQAYQPAPPAPITSQPAPTGPEQAELGEPVTLVQDANGPREVHLTINEISVSETCHHGLNGHTEPTEDGGYYIQMTGEMEAVEGERGYSLSEMWMTGTTADGYATEFTPAFPCENPDLDGYQSFENSVIPGQKARGVLEFWSSDLPETITLTEPYEPVDYYWEVPAQ